MSYSDLVEAIRLIPDDCDRLSAGEIPDTLVESVQQKLGLKFSAEYLAFCRKFEYVTLDEMMLCSVFSQDCVAVDGILEERREAGFPEHLLPFVDGLGLFLDFSVLDEDGEPRVVEVEYIELDEEDDSETEASGCYVVRQTVAGDLGEFLLALAREEQIRSEGRKKQAELEELENLRKDMHVYKRRRFNHLNTIYFIKPNRSVGVFGMLSTWLRPMLRWENLVAIKLGSNHAVGLRADGTVVALGDNSQGQCNISHWRDIIDIEVSYNSTFGIRRDGTVVAAGAFERFYLAQIEAWRDVERICVTADSPFCVHRDGTISALSYEKGDFRSWTDIVDICFAGKQLVGLTRDFRVRCCVIDRYSDAREFDPGSWDKVVAIYGDEYCLYGIRFNGDVLQDGAGESKAKDIAQWREVIAIATDLFYTYAMDLDGNILSSGFVEAAPECFPDPWSRITRVVASSFHCAGIRDDGTVVASGDNAYGQCDVRSWTGIRELAMSNSHTVGLCSDGTVVAAGDNTYGQCDVGHWRNITAISASGQFTVGLRRDGTVVCAGNLDDGLDAATHWNNVRSVVSSIDRICAVTYDGRVLITNGGYSGDYDQKSVQDWRDITSVQFTNDHLVGLTRTGKVLIAGARKNFEEKPFKLFDAAAWTDIVQISANCAHLVGLRKNGTVVAAGENSFGETEVEGWHSVVSVQANAFSTLALRSDGTVLSCGANPNGACDVSGWNHIVSLSGDDMFTLGLDDRGSVMIAGEKRDPRYRFSDLNILINTPTVTELRETERLRAEKQMQQWRDNHRCRYCGGRLNLFKKCTSCKLRN